MNFLVGHEFVGETGLKSGIDLENLVKLAVFAPSSGALDNVTIESDGTGKARLKDLGITGTKLAESVAGDGLAKDGSGNLTVDVDGITLEIDGSGKLVVKDVTSFIVLDNLTLETYDDSGTTKLRVKADSLEGGATGHLKEDSVGEREIAPNSVDFSHWDVEVFTTVETPPVSLGEGLLHIVYEVV